MTQPQDETIGTLETVHTFDDGPMPTGVSVSASGRVFVNFPKWGDDVEFTVAELRDGSAVAYPDQAWSPKLVCVDLTTDTVVRTIVFEPDVALPTTYLNDVRFDLRKGEGGIAYITDSSDQGPNALIVVDLVSGQAWRRLHEHPSTKAMTPPDFLPLVEGAVFMERPADGPAKPVLMGADGIAIAADGSRIYYCPLASRRWYSVDADALADRAVSNADVAATVIDEGDKGGAADGLETDNQGRLYLTSGEHNAILRRLPNGTFETLVHDPRLLWPDTMSVADGYVYVTANQLYRQDKYQGGEDRRRYPYSLFRVAIDAGPVRLHP